MGTGWTAPGGRPHAEAAALAKAGDKAQQSDVYVTLEPCAHASARGPACAELLLAARPRQVIIGIEDPDPRTAGKGIAALRRGGIEVVLANSEAARVSLAGYLLRSRYNRPYVTLKLASSLDGRIALASGESQWITGKAARAHCHAQRARQDAILVGGETWRSDNPRLDVRLAGLEARSPERFVLTRSGASSGAQPLRSPDEIFGLTTAEGPAQYLYVEGGAGAAAAFLRAGLVDRLELYRAPIVLGGDGRPMLDALGLEALGAAHGQWHRLEQRTLGSDVFEAYEQSALRAAGTHSAD